jgi:hypothetical protein
VFNRDGSRIVSEFNAPGSAGDWDERHTVVLGDGSKFSFQTNGDVQEIYDGDGNLISASVWTKDGPKSLPVGQLAFLGPAMLGVGAGVALRLGPRAITAAGLALLAWLESRKDRDGTAVFAFKAAKYEKQTGPKGQSELSWVGYVKRDELEGICKKLETVQELTDEAVKQVRKDGDYDGPADFGTQVHKMIAKEINGQPDPNFRAEVSAIKSELEPREDPNFRANKPKLEAKYGEKGTVRFDAYENHQEKSTVCVYDPKTGKRGLSFPRMTELAKAALNLFHYPPQHIIVIEVRPGQGQQ